MRVNAMTEKFEDVTVLGHPMLFTCARVDRDTVPKGLYMCCKPFDRRYTVKGSGVGRIGIPIDRNVRSN